MRPVGVLCGKKQAGILEDSWALFVLRYRREGSKSEVDSRPGYGRGRCLMFAWFCRMFRRVWDFIRKSTAHAKAESPWNPLFRTSPVLSYFFRVLPDS